MRQPRVGSGRSSFFTRMKHGEPVIHFFDSTMFHVTKIVVLFACGDKYVCLHDIGHIKYDRCLFVTFDRFISYFRGTCLRA